MTWPPGGSPAAPPRSRRCWCLPLLFAAWLPLSCAGDPATIGDPPGPAPTDAGEGPDVAAAAADVGVAPRCGDGVQDPGEVCDDGEPNGTYGHCRSDCRRLGPRCGDGRRDVGFELCDDGEANGEYDRCALDCQGPGPFCGDGALDLAGGEVCDDGPANGSYAACADGCGAGGPFCGDGVLDPEHEFCDDGERNGEYERCARDCQSPGASCGDGWVHPVREGCDDGERNGDYGACGADCRPFGFPPAPAALDVQPAWLEAPPECSARAWTIKYLHYRLRLRGDGSPAHPGFLAVGPGPGQSLPAARRDPQADCAEDPWLGAAGCQGVQLPDAQGALTWEDGTSWLGEYLAVLATERALFGAQGLPTDGTEQELSLALRALERLDEAAEAHFAAPAALDGFFLRDDVPADFHLTAEGGYRFPHPAADEGLAGFECCVSASSCGAPSLASGAYASVDQVAALLYGLALVERLVPEDAAVAGVGLRQSARSSAHRLVAHLRAGGWRITPPGGGPPVEEWGGDGLALSDQLARAANRICGADFGIADYRNEASDGDGVAQFGQLEATWHTVADHRRTTALRLVAVSGTWDPEQIALAAADDSKDVFALAHAVLQGAPLGSATQPWRIESLLSSAPCAGPCTATAACLEVDSWQGPSRTTRPTQRLGGPRWPGGEFNGLDYMLLHNLYLLYRGGSPGLSLPAVQPVACDAFRSLEAILDDGAGDDESWDPAHPCAAADLARVYCGRTFGDWLHAAYGGEAAIHTANVRWRCEGAQPCRLRRGAAQGGPGPDLLLGGPGADELHGGEGDDCLYGLGGDDRLQGGPGRDELHGGEGADSLWGETSGPDVVGEPDRLLGEAGDDHLYGGPDADELLGGDGADRLEGGPGDDLLRGGPANDHLLGGTGDDLADGGAGDDRLEGGGGDDTLWGGPGRDRLRGDGGADWLHGGAGDDLLKGDSGDDLLWSPVADSDVLCGNNGDDQLHGSGDGDRCLGGAGWLGGDDDVQGCTDGGASAEDCDDAAFDSW